MKENQLDLDKILFPVSLIPIYIEKESEDDLFSQDGKQKFRPVDGFKAVIAQDNDHVFSVVAKNYRLITNREALDLGKICFEKVFNLMKVEDMEVFNIVTPRTRSFCHVDFVHPEAESDYFEKDPWTPYLRVTNSYNRTFALNYDLGFCRGICKNGIIFGKNNIEFKFYHSHSATKNPVIKFRLRAGELAALEAEFIESLKNLKRFHVPPKMMWALVCKVFGFNLPEEPTERQQQVFLERKTHVKTLSNLYFPELGENGYAAMNVLTDYASRPVGMISPEGKVDSLQRKSGAWVADFVDAIESRNFNFDNYLGKYAKFVA